MGHTISDVMTRDPVTVKATSPLTDVARRMRDSDIGNVIVMDDGNVCGIVTDRDLAIRGLAEKKDHQAPIKDLCSKDLVTVTPDTSVDDAVSMMRDKAVRRLPVMENGKPVGIVSIGDLAQERDQQSALADISAAPANR